MGIGKEKWQKRKCFLGYLHYGSRPNDPGKALGFFKAGGKFELLHQIGVLVFMIFQAVLEATEFW